MSHTSSSPEHVSARSPLAPSSFPGLHDAYIAVLQDLASAPHHRIAVPGGSGPERLSVSLQILDPAARAPLLSTRKLNVVVNIAEALWLLGGRDDLAMMRYYAPWLASCSADGLTVGGAAYGPRMFRAGVHPGDRSVFDTALELIRCDPDTTCAVLPLLGRHEVVNGQYSYISSVIAFQLLQRGGFLHGVCYTRAADAYRALVSDVFSFTFIQEVAARLLGLELGTYSLHVGSMHIAGEYVSDVHEVLAEAVSTPPPQCPWPRMPTETTSEILDEVCAHEQRLRANLITHTKNSLERTGLPQYWQGIIALLEIYRQVTYESGHRVVRPEIIMLMQPAHHWLAHHTWPDRIPADIDRGIA